MTRLGNPPPLAVSFKGAALPLVMILILIISGLMLLEWRLAWCEQLVGRYLAAINSLRPQTGTVWESGARTVAAHEQLRSIIQGRQKVEGYTRDAASFVELGSGMLPGQWTHISPSRFQQLYLALPAPAAQQLIPPLELVWLMDDEKVSRILCQGTAKGLNLFFLSPANQVQKQIFMSRTTLDRLDWDQYGLTGSLESLSDDAIRIYDAHRFFNAALSLPGTTLSELITAPERLMHDRGRFARVGIWPRSDNGFIQLGFEIIAEKGRRIILCQGREWAVRELVNRIGENG